MDIRPLLNTLCRPTHPRCLVGKRSHTFTPKISQPSHSEPNIATSAIQVKSLQQLAMGQVACCGYRAWQSLAELVLYILKSPQAPENL